MAIGLKKLSDSNVGKKEGQVTEVNSSRLLVSLFIGFVAGALFLLVKGVDDIGKGEFIFSIIAAGYSGTDFIEGLFNTYISKIGNNGTSITQPASTTSFASSERDDEPTTNL